MINNKKATHRMGETAENDALTRDYLPKFTHCSCSSI